MAADRIWIVVLISGFLGLMVDGMDLMFLAYSLPSLMRDLQISQVQAGALASYSLLGMAVGGVCGGWAADRFGRVRVVVWTIVLFSVGTAALGLTQTYWQFAVVRFISALGLGAEYVVCNTLMAEYVPTARRTTVLGTLQAGWSAGYVVAGAIVPTYGWRPLFATALVPVALALFIRKMVPEPPSWKRVSPGPTAVRRASQWKAVFASPRQRRVFVLWSLTACFLQFGYYGVNNWLPTYLVNELGFNFTTMTGYATAAFIPVIVLLHTPGNIIVLLTAFGFLYGVPYGVNATYMTESFETPIRGTAVGGAYNIGRVGAAIAPTLIGLIATHYSIGAGLMVMGGAYFLTGIIPGLFIPEKMYDPQESRAPALAGSAI